MTHHDVTRDQAQLLLTREATLAAHYARRFEQAVGNGDLLAARRWNRQYRLSAFRWQVKSAMEADRVRPVGPRCSAGARGRGVLRPRDEDIAGSSSLPERSRTTPTAA